MIANPTFWHWPGWRQLRFALLLAAAEMLLFLAIYGGADWLAEQHGRRVQMHCAVDLSIPLVPWSIAAYLSLNPMLWMAPFVLRAPHELTALTATLATATLVAGAFFVALPAADAFTPATPAELGNWAGLFEIAHAMALKHNYFPSLHVAFTTICAGIYVRQARRGAKILLMVWAVAIVASTLFTHQHYLLDVASGILLGWLATRLIYRRMLAENCCSLVDTAAPSSPSKYQEQQA